MSLVRRVVPVVDSAPQRLGDGVTRTRHLRLEGYPLPVWLQADSNVRRVVRLDTKPVDLALPIGYVSLLSGHPGEVAPGATYYVATTGSSSNSGDITAPWSLAFAMAGAGGRLQPGDTVLIRGGTYVGNFEPSGPAGSPQARITFRQYGGDAPLGERVKIDGRIWMKRPYWDVRGIELFQSDPVAASNSCTVLGWENGDVTGARFINCVVHDAGETGCTGWLNSRGPSLYYGMIVYNCGTHHNLDHGFYIHDQEKVIENCIAFNNLARNFQNYDSQRPHKHIHFRRNIAFGAGEISTIVGADANFLSRIIGQQTQEDILFDTCVGFHKDASINGCRQLRIGTDGNLSFQQDAAVRNCYFWRGRTFLEIAQWQQFVLEDNTFVNDATASDHLILRAAARDYTSWERNTWYMNPASVKWNYQLRRTFAGFQAATALGATDTATASTPSNRVFVFPNDFEPGRAHVAIFNHAGLGSVAVDLSTVLRVGQNYEVRSVQDLWGTPVASGTYGGGTVSIPMGAIAPPTPIGPGRVFATPPTTGPEFDAFVVLAV